MKKKSSKKEKYPVTKDNPENIEKDTIEDTKDIDVITKVVGVVLIVLNIAWLIVIAPAIYNSLFPNFN